ncbi:MAG: contact-dependent growth inhibition system immunity protein [Bacteroidales bacterium]|jgi:hypothetical protein|nr:contact-dependent growth inhibition system immunity protein [Bacteroidales bacterium]
MKQKDNIILKTLEELENDYWGESNYTSYLVKTCHRLRKISIQDFTIEDLRIMIGQNIGLDYLIPLAIEKLSDNILSEGDFYEGDLLLNVLKSDCNYWKLNKNRWEVMCRLFDDKKYVLEKSDNIEDIKRDWIIAFSEFKKIY